MSRPPRSPKTIPEFVWTLERVARQHLRLGWTRLTLGARALSAAVLSIEEALDRVLSYLYHAHTARSKETPLQILP